MGGSTASHLLGILVDLVYVLLHSGDAVRSFKILLVVMSVVHGVPEGTLGQRTSQLTSNLSLGRMWAKVVQQMCD